MATPYKPAAGVSTVQAELREQKLQPYFKDVLISVYQRPLGKYSISDIKKKESSIILLLSNCQNVSDPATFMAAALCFFEPVTLCCKNKVFRFEVLRLHNKNFTNIEYPCGGFHGLNVLQPGACISSRIQAFEKFLLAAVDTCFEITHHYAS